MIRIFVENITLGKMHLDMPNKKYLFKVLRLEIGEKILVFDGNVEAIALLEKDYINIIEILPIIAKKNIRLAIANIKKEHLELVIEKSTELGVAEIFLLYTKRTQSEHVNYTRLKNIAISAAKQCGRATLPQIHEIMPLEVFIKNTDDSWIFCDLNAQNSKIEPNITGSIIGPEGGWTQQELILLSSKVKNIKLNSLTLRAETAAIVSVFLLSYN